MLPFFSWVVIGSSLGLWDIIYLLCPTLHVGLGQALSCGMCLMLYESLVGHSHSLCITLTPLLPLPKHPIGRTNVGQKLCSLAGIQIPSLEVRPVNRRWRVQAICPTLLWDLAAVILVSFSEFPLYQVSMWGPPVISFMTLSFYLPPTCSTWYHVIMRALLFPFPQEIHVPPNPPPWALLVI